MEDLRDRVFEYMGQDGLRNTHLAKDIADALGERTACVLKALNHEWFEPMGQWRFQIAMSPATTRTHLPKPGPPKKAPGRQVRNGIRDAEIRKLRADGWGVLDLSSLFNITRSRVCQICKD